MINQNYIITAINSAPAGYPAVSGSVVPGVGGREGGRIDRPAINGGGGTQAHHGNVIGEPELTSIDKQWVLNNNA